MPLATLLPLLLLQAGPMVSPGAAPAISQPPLRDSHTRRRRSAEAEAVVTPTPGRLAQCLRLIDSDSATALASARGWAAREQGSARAEPLLCQGAALGAVGNWAEAEAAFREGQQLAAASEPVLRARLLAMAGNAALAQGAAERALPDLASAGAALAGAGEQRLASGVAVDRARALVLLKRPDEAATALDEACKADPDNGEAWLLSATLERRGGRLWAAQTAIEQAARVLPMDAEVGLEAGVIAMLAGHEDAARRSWNSVVATAPDSPAAATARGYLAQLGPVQVPAQVKAQSGSAKKD